MIMFRIKGKTWLLFAAILLQSCTLASKPNQPEDHLEHHLGQPAPSMPQVQSGFVWLSQVDPTIRLAIAYAGPDNFVGSVIDGYEAPACILTAPAAKALARAQAAAVKKGLSLIVFDCYRPQRSVDHFVRWSKDTDEKTKAEYYPGLAKGELFEQGYIAERSGHSRGSTVDLGLVAGTAESDIANPSDACTQSPQPPVLDFGTRFDCFDPLSNTDDPRISAAAKANRAVLLDVMTSAGFRNYSKEWWHFTLRAEPFPETFFSFPVTQRQ